MANKSSSRNNQRKSTPARAPGKNKKSQTGGAADEGGGKVIRLGRTTAAAIQDEARAVKRASRGALRDVSRRTRDLGEGAGELGRRLGDFASEHRYALILGGISVGLAVAANQLAHATRRPGDTPARAREGVNALGQAVASVQDGAQTALGHVERVYSRAEHAVDGTFHAHPLLLGGAVVAAGLAIGFALPLSERENELLEDVGHSVAQRGRRALEDLSEQADHAIQAANNAARFASAAFGRQSS